MTDNERDARRTILSDVADVAGIGCLVAAGWQWNGIVGLALLGVSLVLVGLGLSRK